MLYECAKRIINDISNWKQSVHVLTFQKRGALFVEERLQQSWVWPWTCNPNFSASTTVGLWGYVTMSSLKTTQKQTTETKCTLVWQWKRQGEYVCVYRYTHTHTHTQSSVHIWMHMPQKNLENFAYSSRNLRNICLCFVSLPCGSGLSSNTGVPEPCNLSRSQELPSLLMPVSCPKWDITKCVAGRFSQAAGDPHWDPHACTASSLPSEDSPAQDDLALAW